MVVVKLLLIRKTSILFFDLFLKNYSNFKEENKNHREKEVASRVFQMLRLGF